MQALVVNGHKVTITAWNGNMGDGSLEVDCECGWTAPDRVTPYEKYQNGRADFDVLAQAVLWHRSDVAS